MTARERTGGDRRRLPWLIGARAVVVTLLLGAAALARVRGLPAPWPVDPLIAIAAITFGLTALHTACLPFVQRAPWLVDLQLAADAVVVTAIVLVTGGIQSYLSSLYVLAIVGAGLVRYRRGGLLVAVLGLTLYGGVVLVQYNGGGLLTGLPAAGGPLPRPAEALITFALNGSGFLAVAILTGYLAERLKRADLYIEHASTQIADLRALSDLVVDSLAGGLVTTDRAGRILTFNRAAEVILGIGAREARGQSALGLLGLPHEFRAALDGLEESRRGRRVDYVYEHGDGARIDVGLTAVPLVTPGGRAGLVFTFQDLTEAKRAEREAHRQKRLADVGAMAAGIAHEIRNPLASMSGCVQILRAELALTEEQAGLMDIVLRESNRLNQLIRSFLDYARPRRRVSVRFDVRRLLEDMAALLRHSPECGPGHRVDVEGRVADIWYEADEPQVRQVVWNLATNGLRAMPSGGRLGLGVAARDDGGVELRVADEGVGIAADEMEHIFQPFHSSFANGTGLGLPTVHRIVEDHRGQIRIDSAPGAGTTITVTLPGPATRAAPVQPAAAA